MEESFSEQVHDDVDPKVHEQGYNNALFHTAMQFREDINQVRKSHLTHFPPRTDDLTIEKAKDLVPTSLFNLLA